MDQGLVSMTNFLTGIIIARACSKEELGVYSLCLSIVLFMTNFQVALISTPYIVYSPRFTKSERTSYTGSTLIHQILISIIAIAVFGAVYLILSTGIGPSGMAPVAGALALTVTFILMHGFARRLLLSRLKFEHALSIDAVVAIVQIGLILIMAQNGTLSAQRTYYIMGLACGSAIAIWLYFDHKNIA